MTMGNLPKLCAAAVAVMMVVLTTVTFGQNILPEPLMIGYPEEGKVSGSWEACTTFVREGVPGWTEEQIQQGIRRVCVARNRHIVAYKQFQSEYKRFVAVMSHFHKITMSDVAEAMRKLIKDCMAYKATLSAHAHNISIDVVSNEEAADCLNVGADIIRHDADKLELFITPGDLGTTSDRTPVQTSPANSPRQVASQTSYIGKWYSGDNTECKGTPGAPDSPLVYTVKRVFGQEFACDVVRAIPRGPATELSLSCAGEGETSKESETVEVVGGRLRRTTTVNGKRKTFTYSRCP
jgi:hypothetical protein